VEASSLRVKLEKEEGTFDHEGSLFLSSSP
jgi:hypothetical protein